MAGNIPGSSVVPDVFQVGPISQLDNMGVNARSTNDGALVVQEINGKYAELVRRGYVFAARIGTSQALPNIGTLSNGLTLFNRISSQKIVYPLVLNLSLGTAVATIATAWNALVGGVILNCGDAPASGQPLATAGTALTSMNMLFGAAPTAYTSVYATMTYTAPYAATFPVGQQFDLGYSMPFNGTLTANGSFFFEPSNIDLQQSVPFALKPGTAFVLGVNNSTGGTGSLTFNQTIIWAEIPIGAAVLP